MASSLRLVIDNDMFRDPYGREIYLRGVNLSGDSKIPFVIGDSIDGTSGSSETHNSNEEMLKKTSYVNRPFPLEEAEVHLSRIKACGFNTIRYVFTWEALEPTTPGTYDYDFVDFTVKILKILTSQPYEFHVIMDPHQDIWSRFSGGSGAPAWTFQAAGIDPYNLEPSLAAILHDPTVAKENQINMLWASNYHRLAAMTMFTLFFAGKVMAPKCIINDVNIQDYLQSRYLEAIKVLANAIQSSGIVLLGWESLNEPSHGFLGLADLTQLPTELRHVKLGPCPTPFQSIQLGLGDPNLEVPVEHYTFTTFGPRKTGTISTIASSSCWLTLEQRTRLDKYHQWQRTSEWTSGCIWQLHGIVDSTGRNCLTPQYFADSDLMHDKTHNFFLNHWTGYVDALDGINPTWYNFFQPPVNTSPPKLPSKHLPSTVYSPHFYDGLTLMLKKWNRIFNVDGAGIVRDKYASPILGLKIGDRNIKQGIMDQLALIKSEAELAIAGDVDFEAKKDDADNDNEKIDNVAMPVLVTEIGIPFDIDDGNERSRIRAMDVHCLGLEANKLNHTLWVYTCHNNQRYGDNWNGEDFSIYSTSITKNDFTNSELCKTSILWGIRALPAVVRPVPLAVAGTILSFQFDLLTATFTMRIDGSKIKTEAPSDTLSNADISKNQTTIFLPLFHFPRDQVGVSVTSGKWNIVAKPHRESLKLYWKHNPGHQLIQVKGVPTTTSNQCTII